MLKTIYKWFWGWDYDNEEDWLNYMAEKGYALVDIGFCRYTFKKCDPSEYTYRIEFLESSRFSNELEYIRFVESTGAELVGRYFRWAYFRKKTNGDKFELFSDNKSKISHMKRLIFLFLMLGISQLCFAISNIGMGVSDIGSFNLYLGIFNALLCSFLFWGAIKFQLKIHNLKQDLNLFDE